MEEPKFVQMFPTTKANGVHAISSSKARALSLWLYSCRQTAA